MFVIKNEEEEYVELFIQNRPTLIMIKDINRAMEYDCKSHAEEIKNNIIKTLHETTLQVVEVPDKKGFTITCNVCGSTNCRICEEIDYDYDENPYTNGYYLRCDDCGEDNREEWI